MREPRERSDYIYQRTSEGFCKNEPFDLVFERYIVVQQAEKQQEQCVQTWGKRKKLEVAQPGASHWKSWACLVPWHRNQEREETSAWETVTGPRGLCAWAKKPSLQMNFSLNRRVRLLRQTLSQPSQDRGPLWGIGVEAESRAEEQHGGMQLWVTAVSYVFTIYLLTTLS